MSTDKVLFEIGFTAGSAVAPTVDTAIMYDSVRCQMEMNTQDNRFWVPTLNDGFYTKAKANAATIQEPDPEISDNNSWTTPFSDNKPASRWCTPANTSTIWSEYQCTALSCYMQRLLNTGDSVNDIAFKTSGSTIDTMIIPAGLARLYFNKSSYNFPILAPASQLSFNVYDAAVTLCASAAFAAAYLLF